MKSRVLLPFPSQIGRKISASHFSPADLTRAENKLAAINKLTYAEIDLFIAYCSNSDFKKHFYAKLADQSRHVKKYAMQALGAAYILTLDELTTLQNDDLIDTYLSLNLTPSYFIERAERIDSKLELRPPEQLTVAQVNSVHDSDPVALRDNLPEIAWKFGNQIKRFAFEEKESFDDFYLKFQQEFKNAGVNLTLDEIKLLQVFACTPQQGSIFRSQDLAFKDRWLNEFKLGVEFDKVNYIEVQKVGHRLMVRYFSTTQSQGEESIPSVIYSTCFIIDKVHGVFSTSIDEYNSLILLHPESWKEILAQGKRLLQNATLDSRNIENDLFLFKPLLIDPKFKELFLAKVGLLPIDKQKEIIRHCFPEMVVEGRSRHQGNLLLTILDYIAIPISSAFRLGFKAGFHLGYLAYGRRHDNEKSYRPHIIMGYIGGGIAALIAIAAIGVAAYFAAPYIAFGLAATGTQIGMTMASSLVSCAIAALASFSFFNTIGKLIANSYCRDKVPTAAELQSSESDSDSENNDDSPRDEKQRQPLHNRQRTFADLDEPKRLYDAVFLGLNDEENSPQRHRSSTLTSMNRLDNSSGINSPRSGSLSQVSSSSRTTETTPPIAPRTPQPKRTTPAVPFVTLTPKPIRRVVTESTQSNSSSSASKKNNNPGS